MIAWVPVATRTMSPSKRQVFRSCRLERQAMRNTDCMLLYQGRISVCQFIDKWHHSFSPIIRTRLLKIKTYIIRHANYFVLLFVVKLKMKINQGNKRRMNEDQKEVTAIHTEEKEYMNKCVQYTRPSIQRDLYRDLYNENPMQIFMNTLRH